MFHSESQHRTIDQSERQSVSEEENDLAIFMLMLYVLTWWWPIQMGMKFSVPVMEEHAQYSQQVSSNEVVNSDEGFD